MWRAEQEAVRLDLERFSAVIDPRDPARGLTEVRVDGQPLDDCELLKVELQTIEPQAGAVVTTRASDESSTSDPTSFDCYLRRGDLIATYADRPAPAMRTQIYWRIDSRPRAGTIAAIELLTSVQSSLLDSCPQLSAGSQMIVSEAFKLTGVDGGSPNFTRIAPQSQWGTAGELSLAPHCFLLRPATGRFSYVEIVAPGDVQKSDWDCWLQGGDFRMRLHHELFAEQLEKGVILRSRALGAIIDRADDMALAARQYADFLTAALPLTT